MKLLLVGDERKNRRLVAWGFSSDPYDVRATNSRRGVAELLDSERFQAACIDTRMQEDDANAIVGDLQARLPSLPIVALVAAEDRKLISDLRARGVAGHVASPFPIEKLRAVLRAHALAEPIGLSRVKEPERTPAPPRLLTGDETARECLAVALRAANSTATILILGETGTGKTLLAQTVHEHSPLREHPFVTVNCPSLNHELLESELFGHVRGAFTGAVQETWGKVAAAEGGTLFLDEVGDLPMGLQAKLLRLLQEKQYERVGEAKPRSANVRIIAATNRDLKREVAAGRFREDLYYRLNVIAIDVPPVRGRPAQILGAVEFFLEAICRQLGRPAPSLAPAARRALESYGWPGNLRELRNVVERAAILSTGPILDATDFPAIMSQPSFLRFQVGGAISLHALETAHIQMVVANSPSLEEAARILEIDKSTLYRKRKAMEARAKLASREFAVAAAGG